MMTHTKQARNNRACCRDESKMVRCAVTALEKMRDYLFETTVAQDAENSSSANYNCATDYTKYTTQACPFRGAGMPPNLMRTFCTNNKKSTGSNMIRLLPGQVGVAGDRATFHLGHAATGKKTGAVAPNNEDNVQSTGPTTIVVDRPTATKYINVQRKRAMQVLPAVPASANRPAVGPVTGIPVDDEEHVFVLRLSKAYANPDDVACLQVEIRLPNPPAAMKRKDVETQFLDTDVIATPKTTGKKKKSKKSSRKGKRGKGKND